jgi:hypothetical protein
MQVRTVMAGDPAIGDRILVDVLNEPDNYGVRWEAGGGKPGLTELYLSAMDAMHAVAPHLLFFIEVCLYGCLPACLPASRHFHRQERNNQPVLCTPSMYNTTTGQFTVPLHCTRLDDQPVFHSHFSVFFGVFLVFFVFTFF